MEGCFRGVLRPGSTPSSMPRGATVPADACPWARQDMEQDCLSSGPPAPVASVLEALCLDALQPALSPRAECPGMLLCPTVPLSTCPSTLYVLMHTSVPHFPQIHANVPRLRRLGDSGNNSNMVCFTLSRDNLLNV